MKNIFKSQSRFAGALSLVLLAGFISHVQAQPVDNQQSYIQQLQQLPPDQQKMMVQFMLNLPPEQVKQVLGQIPPEQINQLNQWAKNRIQEDWANWIKQTLVASGFTDSDLQEDVVAFIQNQEEARQPLRAMAQKITTFLIKPDSTDAEFQKQLTDFREAMKKEDSRYKDELSALDVKIKYSSQPRLEALLTILGVVGQETSTLGGLGTLFPESPMSNLRTSLLY